MEEDIIGLIFVLGLFLYIVWIAALIILPFTIRGINKNTRKTVDILEKIEINQRAILRELKK